MILSSDCHAGGAIMDYKPYLETRWHDEFDAWAASFHDGWADKDDGDGAGLKFGAASVAEAVGQQPVRVVGALPRLGTASSIVPAGVTRAYPARARFSTTD